MKKTGFLFDTMRDAHNQIQYFKNIEYKTFRNYKFRRWTCEVGVYDDENDTRKDGLFIPTTNNGMPSMNDILHLKQEALERELKKFTIFFTAQLDVAENIQEYKDGIYEPAVAYVDVDLYKHSDEA